MSQCNDHKTCRQTAMEQAEIICQQHGARLTPTRRAVLEKIWANHEATKAYDLISQLSTQNETVKPPTVYRALEFLLAHGLIHRIESLNAFVGCSHPQTPHQAILLICKQCGDIQEVADQQIRNRLQQISTEHAFALQREMVELRGLCNHCQSQPDNNES